MARGRCDPAQDDPCGYFLRQPMPCPCPPCSISPQGCWLAFAPHRHRLRRIVSSCGGHTTSPCMSPRPTEIGGFRDEACPVSLGSTLVPGKMKGRSIIFEIFCSVFGVRSLGRRHGIRRWSEGAGVLPCHYRSKYLRRLIRIF